LRRDELRATGGFARSPFWRQLLADVLGTAIGFPVSPQGSAVGAALLGHVVLEHLPSIDEAAALVQVTDVVHPDPNTAECYRRLRPGFAATAEAIEQAQLWRPERTPTDRCGKRAADDR
jgi:gluconokinase